MSSVWMLIWPNVTCVKPVCLQKVETTIPAFALFLDSTSQMVQRKTTLQQRVNHSVYFQFIISYQVVM